MPLQVKPRPVTAEEKHLAMAFQEALRLLVEFSEIASPKPEQYQIFRNKIMRYSNLPFFGQIKERLAEIDQKLASIEATSLAEPSHMFEMIKKTEHALRSGNAHAFVEFAHHLHVEEHQDRWVNPTDIIKKWPHHAWHKQNPLFFGTTGILDQFEKEDQKEVLDINLDKPLWTYLTIPDNKLSDYEYMIWWILHLCFSPDEVTIEDRDFKIYAKYAFAGPEFEQLEKLIQNYLSSNEKSLLPDILKLMIDIPEVAKLNAQRKQEIHIVYRGIPVTENMSNKQIIVEDFKNHYIATSTSNRAARNFALRKGHLESDEARRTEDGVIITYSVTPSAILFDTSILGGIFNESEVVVDSHKATVKSIVHV